MAEALAALAANNSAARPSGLSAVAARLPLATPRRSCSPPPPALLAPLIDICAPQVSLLPAPLHQTPVGIRVRARLSPRRWWLICCSELMHELRLWLLQLYAKKQTCCQLSSRNIT